MVVVASAGTVVVLADGSTVVVVSGGAEVGGVVVVVDPAPVALGSVTTIGVVEPGVGCHPGGGAVWEGTAPAAGTTTGAAGAVAVGGRWTGTGAFGSWTRPKPARSDHQIGLTRITSPVWGALIIRPSPMYMPTWWMSL